MIWALREKNLFRCMRKWKKRRFIYPNSLAYKGIMVYNESLIGKKARISP